jgi:cation:H+ antiporter
MPAWAIFLISAAAVVLAGSRMSRDGDTIAERTGLGGAWVGAILVAGATSLPELATDIYAVRAGLRELAIGDLFGSCMANILILAVADLAVTHVRVLTRVTINQVLVGLLAISLLVIAVLGAVAHLNVSILGIGWGPLLVGFGYLIGMRLLHVNRHEPLFETTEEAANHEARAGALRTAVLGFILSTVVILAAARFLASSAGEIARQMGVSGGFIGMVLVALTTSLPEVTVSVAAVRSGSYDLAVGNLLGSNCFNMAILLILDIVDGPGPLLASTEPGLLVGALFAILLTAQALLGVLNKSERRVWYLEPDALFLILIYGTGLYVTYRVGH